MNKNKYINADSQLFGVLGHPLGHSLSPQLHAIISNILNKNIAYIPLDVSEGNLSSAVMGLKSLNFKGFNVTIPYKKSIINYMDSLTETALRTNSVNTVKIEENGNLIGHSTDGYGFMLDFQRFFKTDFSNKKVICLGAGGAAFAICQKIAENNPKELYIASRDIKKSTELVSNIAKDKIYAIDYEHNFKKIIKDCHIIINATSVGMAPNNNVSILEPDDFYKGQLVYDIIYNPKDTLFIKNALATGAQGTTGIGMLIGQAIAAWEFWYDIKIDTNIFTEIIKSFSILSDN